MMMKMLTLADVCRLVEDGGYAAVVSKVQVARWRSISDFLSWAAAPASDWAGGPTRSSARKERWVPAYLSSH